MNEKDKGKARNTDHPDKNDKIDDLIPEEILEALPEEDRGEVSRIIKQTMISGVMRRGNPISEKITPEHITALIEKSEKSDIRDRKERKSEKYYNIALIIIGLLFIGFLIIFL